MTADKGQFRYWGILTLLIACALGLTAHAVYLYLEDTRRFPINTVKIAADYTHISHKQLETILENYLNFSFFSLPVRQLTKELMVLEWASSVQVERIWPETLKITLVEKKPFAVWNQAMVTEEGLVFNEGDPLKDNSLPYLLGPQNQVKQVLQVYKKLSKILTAYGLYLTALELRKNEAWELVLSNGVRLRLGKQDLEKKIERFCKAFPAVFTEENKQLVSVDLRYPRGMAVQWKKTGR